MKTEQQLWKKEKILGTMDKMHAKWSPNRVARKKMPQGHKDVKESATKHSN